MDKYIIEGNIDFFAELYKSLDDDNSDNESTELCLITNQPLTDKHVILKCGHKFNYIPLFNDVLNHKKKFNNMEGKHGELNTTQIRCPYCRNKQNELLPYYEELGLDKINGINFYDTYNKSNISDMHFSSYNKHTINKKCEFSYVNSNYKSDEPITETNQPYLSDVKCACWGSPINLYNTNDPSIPIDFCDTKSYCYKHKLTMIKQYKNEIKIKEKLAAKKAKEEEKIKAKEYLKKAKEELKQTKMLEKINKKNNISANVVIGSSNIIIENNENNGCVQILKTGLNKGNQCGCKIFANNLCKRHQSK